MVVCAGDHDHVIRDDHKYHIGIGGTGALITHERGIKPSLHFHFVRQLGENRTWGVGLGYESILEKQLHQGVYILLNYHLFENLVVNIAPCFTFGKHNSESEINPAAHLEAVYEIEAGLFHFGPMLGFGIDPGDAHFSAGLHIGFGF